MKYKQLTYGSGIGKTFLNEASFPVEDQLTDFEFNQAYTNWLMLIETVSDPAMEQGWHAPHKCMVSDRGFVKWAQAWHVHDHLLCSQFMQKPFILDGANPAYKKQLKCCKLDQALQCMHGESHEYMHLG